MTAIEFLIMLTHAAGGTIHGRTLLQKLCFFTGKMSKIDANLGFDAHFYGPYSSVVETAVAQLKSVGLIVEGNNAYGIYSGGFEVKRYDYSLTREGEQIAERLCTSPEYAQVKLAFDRIRDAGGLDYVSLSFAAKVYFIMTRQGSPMTREAIQREAPKFNWNIPDNSTEKAISFLMGVGLAVQS